MADLQSPLKTLSHVLKNSQVTYMGNCSVDGNWEQKENVPERAARPSGAKDNHHEKKHYKRCLWAGQFIYVTSNNKINHLSILQKGLFIRSPFGLHNNKEGRRIPCKNVKDHNHFSYIFLYVIIR